MNTVWFHVAEIIIAIIILGALIFKIVAPTSKDVYQAGSQPVQYDTKNYGLINLGGCAHWAQPKEVKK